MSTIKVDTIQDTSGNGQFTAKAWVNFNGTGTVAIRADGNVSSITDNGTGNYTINFTTPMQAQNYIASVNGGQDDGTISRTPLVNNKTTSSCRVTTTIISNGNLVDTSITDIAILL